MKHPALVLLALSIVPGVAVWSCASEETTDGAFSEASGPGSGGAGATATVASATSGSGGATSTTSSGSASSTVSSTAAGTATVGASSSAASGGGNCTTDIDCFIQCLGLGTCVNGMCQCMGGLDGGFPDGFDFDGGFDLDGFSLDGFSFDGGLPDF